MGNTDIFLPKEIFKAYDIRGIVDKTLTEENVFAIGQALGSLALQKGQKQFVVGRDGRLTGPRLSDAMAKGLLSTGIDVIDIGVAPTPVVYFATHHLNTGTGVAITGSHNPPEYNGLKMMVDGVTLSGDEITSLRDRIIARDLLTGEGNFKQVQIDDDYIDRIKNDVSLKRPMKIVMDSGNGVAGGIAPELFRAIGCEVVELFCEVDGTFPNHHPDPSQLENLEDLIKTVKETDAEFGIAFDGDGDRLGVITKKGDIVWPDRQMLLFSRDILSREPGAEIIFDVKCSRLLPMAIEAAGGKATMWKTGHSLIKRKLKETGAALAGEMSGHIFFKERWYGFDDGLYAGVRLCEYLSGMDQSPQQVFDSLPDTINTPELRLDMEEGENYVLVDKVVAAASFDDATVSNIDGLRVDFNNGFGLVRASNTTPIVIMRFEADDRAALDNIQSQFRKLFTSVEPGIKLPF